MMERSVLVEPFKVWWLLFFISYLRCSPLVNQLSKQQNGGFHRLSELLRSFWPRKTPKLAMFGPGMEASTHRIVRNIIDGHTDLFTVVRMFPGQFGGKLYIFNLYTHDTLQ